MATPHARSFQEKEAARRTANNHFSTGEQRPTQEKQQLAAERQAVDAKTARLRALRLAKEELDREAARIAAEKAPAASKKRTDRTG